MAGGKGAKGGRVGLIRYPNDWSDSAKRGSTFLFVECKEPEEYDADRKYLEGQLFNLAKQELPTPSWVSITQRSQPTGKCWTALQ